MHPAHAGAIDVRAAPYNACGDGKTDDTAAIQRALSDGLDKHKVVYLPAGTYLVSDTLRWWRPGYAPEATNGWGAFLMLQGEGCSRTVLRLKDSATGYADPAVPKAVLATGSRGYHGSKGYKQGEGNEAFENHLRDLTVDTGRGNPGAVGIDYQASNVGAMRRVTVRSGDGAGAVGIDLRRRDNGPGLIKDVAVDGFRVGVRASDQPVCVFVLEDVAVSGHTEAAVANGGSVLGVRRLTARGAAPALKVSGGSLTHLLESRASGDPTGKAGASKGPAVLVEGDAPRLHVRDLKTWRFAASVRGSGGKDEKAERVGEWVSGAAGAPSSPGLPPRDTPDFWEPDSARWADAGAPSGRDDTDALQAALDSGRAAVCLRYGTYKVSRTLRVPRSVRLVFGVGAGIDAAEALKPGEALFRIEGGGDTTPPVVFDRFLSNAEGRTLVEHASPRPVVLRDLLPFGADVYRNRAGAGPLFIEDVSSAGYRFEHPTSVWARNWDFEGRGEPKVRAVGLKAWCLGFKHEGDETIFENRGGGDAELMAGLAYTFGVPEGKPAFVNEAGSRLSLSLLAVSFAGGERPFFPVLARGIDKGGATTADVSFRRTGDRGVVGSLLCTPVP